jgi:hypothetical protein
MVTRGRGPFHPALPLLLALALSGAGCASLPSLSPGGGARVRVTYRDAPAAGTVVEFRDSPAPDGKALLSAAAGADGTADFVLPRGRRLFLFARSAASPGAAPLPGECFAYFGGNPVMAAPGPPAEFHLSLSEVPPAPSLPEGERHGTAVAGTVLVDGAPLADARVFAYLRPDASFRDLGFAASAPTGEDGFFRLDLPPGPYYLVVRRRAGGGVAGPMKRGDHFGYWPGNPVRVEEGKVTAVSIPAVRLRSRNAPSWGGEAKAAAYVEGRILDERGKPRAGVHAALYDNPEALNRPVLLSGETGEDGRYRIAVPVPGRYYLGARSGYGGSPAPGDLYGRYEGSADHSVRIREGERLEGMDVTVHPSW